MSIIKTIKSWFQKDLASITSSFTKIHDDLIGLMSRLSEEIDAHSITIEFTKAKQTAALLEREAAIKIKDTIKAVLGQ